MIKPPITCTSTAMGGPRAGHVARSGGGGGEEDRDGVGEGQGHRKGKGGGAELLGGNTFSHFLYKVLGKRSVKK